MASLKLAMVTDQQADHVRRALQDLARGLTDSFASPIPGDAEDQLKSHLRPFVEAAATALGSRDVVVKTESRVAAVRGRPDFGVGRVSGLTGHIELKAPGRRANPNRYTGRDRRQWDKFKSLPNLIYTDGLEWTLFHSGKRIDGVRLSGDLTADGPSAVTLSDARQLADLLHTFFSWQPIAPATPRQLAETLAPLARLLRRDVLEALRDSTSAISQLRRDWRSVLFANADSNQFADAYAQTLTYALLLARLGGLDTAGANIAQDTLRERGHTLLADVLRTLAHPQAQDETETSVKLLERVIGAVDVDRLRRGGADPWLYFYEDFLAEYDPKLRNDRGVYYTPVQVVRAQVRLVGQLLRERFHKDLTFAHDGVVTLDPAAGTGSYPLAVIEHALTAVANRMGTGAVPGHASALARSVNAFELLVGPYAVAHLRVSERIEAHGGALPDDGAHVYLTDSLESPHAATPGLVPLSLRTLGDEHERARRIKDTTRVLVCLGNPPYDRQEIDIGDDQTQRKGGWVRFREPDAEEDSRPLLEDFLNPARQAGAGVHLKNVYNDYVYFWRWALWKVFDSTEGAGIVSFITAASYLRGPGFVGMREVMRRTFDELWIIDLEGDSLGARKTENVFAIRTPVAIAVGVRYGSPKPNEPATVRYVRLAGTAKEKLDRLDQIHGFDDLDWQPCFEDWQQPLLPKGSGDYWAWPALTDVFPWQQSGVKAGRTWPVAPSEEVLKRRWQALLDSPGETRRVLFKDSPTGRRLDSLAERVTPHSGDNRRISALDSDSPFPGVAPVAYRSFDRQWIVADGRLMDRSGPPLWHAHGDRQVYLTSLLTNVLGPGPAVTAAAHLPDLDHFRGSYGAKHVVPLWRDSDATEPNVTDGLLETLGSALECEVTPEDLCAYALALLASPAYVDRFGEELIVPGPRLPLTKDPALFQRAATLGAKLIQLHTYGERFADHGLGDALCPAGAGLVPARNVQPGSAKCVHPVGESPDAYPDRFEYIETTKTLVVGAGCFEPVHLRVWEFSVSGFRVVRSWLRYRMRQGAGHQSSPLDAIRPTLWTAQFTDELLELLWTLEATLDHYPALADLLDAITAGPTFTADELPQPSNQQRQAPKVDRGATRGTGYAQPGL